MHEHNRRFKAYNASAWACKLGGWTTYRRFKAYNAYAWVCKLGGRATLFTYTFYFAHYTYNNTFHRAWR